MQHDAVGRHVLGEPYVTANNGVMAYTYTTEDGSIGIDGDMVLQNRVTRNIFGSALCIVFEILRTERHALIEHHMRTDDGCLADDDACTMVYAEILTNLRS